VAILESQISQREPVTLPSSDTTCHVLSKRTGAQFILQALALAESTPAEQGIFVYYNGAPVRLLDVLAMIHGVQLNSEFSVKFLHSNSHNGTMAATTSDHERLVATAHARIGWLPEMSLPDSSEVSTAIHYLLSLQEQHLAHAAWEQHTRTLSHLGSIA
jgi:hypothetical protein